MKNYKTTLCIGTICGFLSLMGVDGDLADKKGDPSGLLIFLDDTQKQFASEAKLLSVALLQEAGPIVASMVLLVNVYQKEVCGSRLSEKWKATSADPVKFASERLDILRCAVGFDEAKAQKWVIKKINSSLCVLLPEKYLQDRNIARRSVEETVSSPMLTPVEQKLGLKVNHMETITAKDFSSTGASFEFADYFIENLGTIFVTHNDYHESGYQGVVPVWTLFITGHGLTAYAIAHLSIEQFKKFLLFLETNISTKLLYYMSCLAGGINNELIYKDREKNEAQTYSFVIITQALTDASIIVKSAIYHLDGALTLDIFVDFFHFFENAVTTGSLNYSLIASFLTPPLKDEALGSLPQIRLPGSTYFSVLDQDKVLSFESEFLKINKQSLDVIASFKEKPNASYLLALLLYEEDIPFELIINTQDRLPAIISMMPGDAVHHLKKISSAQHTVQEVMSRFVALTNLVAQKTFIIDEISGLLGGLQAGNVKGSISGVLIELTETKNSLYFSFKDTVYKGDGTVYHKATVEQEADYRLLLRNGLLQVSTKQEAQQQADMLFSSSLTAENALNTLRSLLYRMPSGSSVHVSELRGISCLNDRFKQCWQQVLTDITRILICPQNKPKYLKIDQLAVEAKLTGQETSIPLYENVIIMSGAQGYKVWYNQQDQRKFMINGKIYDRVSGTGLYSLSAVQ